MIVIRYRFGPYWCMCHPVRRVVGHVLTVVPYLVCAVLRVFRPSGLQVIWGDVVQIAYELC